MPLPPNIPPRPAKIVLFLVLISVFFASLLVFLLPLPRTGRSTGLLGPFLYFFCSPSPRPKATAARWTKPASNYCAKSEAWPSELGSGTSWRCLLLPFSCGLSPPAGIASISRCFLLHCPPLFFPFALSLLRHPPRADLPFALRCTH